MDSANCETIGANVLGLKCSNEFKFSEKSSNKNIQFKTSGKTFEFSGKNNTFFLGFPIELSTTSNAEGSVLGIHSKLPKCLLDCVFNFNRQSKYNIKATIPYELPTSQIQVIGEYESDQSNASISFISRSDIPLHHQIPLNLLIDVK